jgi:DNA-binding MarR family transcriptional regulator
MTPQAMIEVLNALEHKGLIRRDTHPNHRRVYPASLTDEGRSVLAACDASVEEMEEEMLAGLDPAQRRLLADWLRGCVRALHAGLPSDGNPSATGGRGGAGRLRTIR